MLDDLGMVPAIEWLVENFVKRTDVACELDLAEDVGRHPIHRPDPSGPVVAAGAGGLEGMADVLDQGRAGRAPLRSGQIAPLPNVELATGLSGDRVDPEPAER